MLLLLLEVLIDERAQVEAGCERGSVVRYVSAVVGSSLAASVHVHSLTGDKNHDGTQCNGLQPPA